MGCAPLPTRPKVSRVIFRDCFVAIAYLLVSLIEMQAFHFAAINPHAGRTLHDFMNFMVAIDIPLLLQLQIE